MPVATLVVCNYNRKEKTTRCLRKLVEQDCDDLRILLVDNASTDGSDEYLEKTFAERVEVIRNQENLGGSGGFRTGLEVAMEAETEFVGVVDSDCYAERDTFRKLVSFLRKNPAFSGAAPAILRADDEEVLQEVGGYVDWENLRIGSHFANRPASEVGETYDVDFLAATCALFRSVDIRQAGLMEPEWFIYYDDVDWCVRLTRLGKRLAALGEAMALHDSGIGSCTTLFHTFYEWRNRIAFFMRHARSGDERRTREILAEQAASALATCEVLGLKNKAHVIEQACADGFIGRLGRRDLEAFSMRDKPNSKESQNEENRIISVVGHCLRDASEELAQIRGLVLRDGFGWELRADEAFGKQADFLALKDALFQRFALPSKE